MKKLEELNKVSRYTCGIYLIKIDKHLYVGSSLNISSRLSDHRMRLRKSRHCNPIVQAAFTKYGEDSCTFTVLEECPPEVRISTEKKWIDSLSPDMNIIQDPVSMHNCVTTSKVVYQYTLSGNFVAEYPSASEASRQLKCNGHTITKCCTGKHGHKSCKRSLWSYEKHEKLPGYRNKSSEAKIKAVTMYDREGKRLGRFNSIAGAAREIQEPGDTLDVLCACISSVACGKGNFVKGKYMFSYQDHTQLLKVLSRGYPVISVEPNGTEVLYKNTKEAAEAIQGSQLGINRVIRGERSSYKGLIWKIGSGSKTP